MLPSGSYSLIRPLAVILAFLATSTVLALAAPPSSANWTIMIFMNGDNNLEPDALLNFRQAARVGSTDQVNVVVEFDRIAKYAHTTPDWSQTLRFRITRGMEPLPSAAVEDIGEANMGDPHVLADFVTWSRSKYPAKHYMLVIWDHGQGWRLFLANLLKRDRMIKRSRALAPVDSAVGQRAASVLLRSGNGIAGPGAETAPFRSAPGDPYRSASNDETDNDVLYDREIEDGLKQALGGEKLDVIGFDACLMSMVETAYALRDVGTYMVGSEELEPGFGWKYDDWLSAIEANPTLDASGVAKATVTAYQKYYSDPAHSDASTTLSAIDLTKVNAVASSITDLSDSLIRKIDTQVQQIIEARQSTLVYAPGYTFYHIDLTKFLDEFSARTGDGELRQKSQTAKAAIKDAVLANYAGTDRQGAYGSYGLAIYFPDSNAQHLGDPYAEGGYEKDNDFYPVEFVQQQHWADFLHAYWMRVP